MDIIQTFILDNNSYEVNILWKDGKPLFQANQIAKILDIKNVHSSLNKFNSNQKVLQIADTQGGEQYTTFLTEAGVYRLLMRSTKPIAQPFQEWFVNILISIREKGKYELKEEIEKVKSENNNIKNENDLLKLKYEEGILSTTHKIFMDSYDNKNVVYFIKIKNIEDKQLIKIGSTQDIQTRGRGLKSRFNCNVAFIKVFELNDYENFERFLLNHIDIKKYLYKDNNTYGVNNSTELFLMTNEQLEKAMNIADRNLSLFAPKNNIKIKKTMRKSIDELKNEIQSIKSILQNKNEEIKVVNNDVDDDEVKDDVQYENKRGICTINGNKIQRYSPDGKELQETYDSIIHALRDPKIPKPSRNGISDAVERNSIYVGYRWAFLDRELPDNTIQELEPSIVIKAIKKGYICELNVEKNKIIKVYSNQKDLAKQKNQKSSGWISTAIKEQKLYNGYYYINWTDCPDELQQEYLKDHELPDLIDKLPHQIKINRLDPETKEVLHTYSSLTEVTTKYKMTRRTLYSAINGDLVKREFKWSFTNPKIN